MENQTKISDIEKTIQLIESKIDELKKGVWDSMSKQRIPVFLDMENEDALKELKTYLPVDEDIKDSPIIRYALLELLNRVRK